MRAKSAGLPIMAARPPAARPAAARSLNPIVAAALAVLAFPLPPAPAPAPAPARLVSARRVRVLTKESKKPRRAVV